MASKSTYYTDSDEEGAASRVNQVEDGYHTSSSDSDYEEECSTPPTKRRSNASDSGCGTGPSSSKYNRFMNKYVSFNGKKTPETAPGSSGNGHASDDEHRNARFRKRVRKARVNLRNRACLNDSDSN